MNLELYKLLYLCYNTLIMVNFLQAKKLLLLNKTYWHILSVVFMSGFLLSYLFFGQNLWLYLFTLLVCLTAILISPKAGLYTVFFCAMIFEQKFTLQELTIGESSFKIYPLDFIILFTFISVVAHAITKRVWLKFKKFDLWILAFGLLCTFGFVVAFMEHARFTFAFSTYKNYFLYSILYFLTYWILRTKKDWQEFMSWFAVVGLCLFFFLFYGIINGSGLWSEITPLSTSGTRLIAGTHVFYLTLFSFWVLGGWLFDRPLFPRFGTRGNLIIYALYLLALVVSLVRHLWLALFILAVVWLVVMTKKQTTIFWDIAKKFIFAGLFGLVVFVWGYSMIFGNIPQELNKAGYVLSSRISISNLVSLEDDSFRWRLNAWSAGLSLWQTSPIIGVGLGQMVIGSDKDTIYEVPVRELHNDYLGVLIQLGVFGAFYLLIWFMYLVAQLYRVWQKYKRENSFYTQLLFTWGNTVLLFIIVFGVSVYLDLNAFLIWWWLALSGIRFLIYENTAS